MNRYKKLPKLIMTSDVQLKCRCEDCGVVSDIIWDDLSTEHNGGCQGHGPEEYCYCSGNKLSVSYTCRGCRKQVYILHEAGFTY